MSGKADWRVPLSERQQVRLIQHAVSIAGSADDARTLNRKAISSESSDRFGMGRVNCSEQRSRPQRKETLRSASSALPLPIPPEMHSDCGRPAGYEEWTPARRRAWNRRTRDPDKYLMHYLLADDEMRLQKLSFSDKENTHSVCISQMSRWILEEHVAFVAALNDYFPFSSKWGLFSAHIPSRSGTQCRDYFKLLVRCGYVSRETGRMNIDIENMPENSKNPVFLRAHVRRFLPQILPTLSSARQTLMDRLQSGCPSCSVRTRNTKGLKKFYSTLPDDRRPQTSLERAENESVCFQLLSDLIDIASACGEDFGQSEPEFSHASSHLLDDIMSMDGDEPNTALSPQEDTWTADAPHSATGNVQHAQVKPDHHDSWTDGASSSPSTQYPMKLSFHSRRVVAPSADSGALGFEDEDSPLKLRSLSAPTNPVTQCTSFSTSEDLPDDWRSEFAKADSKSEKTYLKETPLSSDMCSRSSESRKEIVDKQYAACLQKKIACEERAGVEVPFDNIVRRNKVLGKENAAINAQDKKVCKTLRYLHRPRADLTKKCSVVKSRPVSAKKPPLAPRESIESRPLKKRSILNAGDQVPRLDTGTNRKRCKYNSGLSPIKDALGAFHSSLKVWAKSSSEAGKSLGHAVERMHVLRAFECSKLALEDEISSAGSSVSCNSSRLLHASRTLRKRHGQHLNIQHQSTTSADDVARQVEDALREYKISMCETDARQAQEVHSMQVVSNLLYRTLR